MEQNTSVSRGPGGLNKIEACPGGIYKSVSGEWRHNKCMSRGFLIYIILSPGGGGMFAIIIIHKLNTEIAHCTNHVLHVYMVSA